MAMLSDTKPTVEQQLDTATQQMNYWKERHENVSRRWNEQATASQKYQDRLKKWQVATTIIGIWVAIAMLVLATFAFGVVVFLSAIIVCGIMAVLFFSYVMYKDCTR